MRGFAVLAGLLIEHGSGLLGGIVGHLFGGSVSVEQTAQEAKDAGQKAAQEKTDELDQDRPMRKWLLIAPLLLITPLMTWSDTHQTTPQSEPPLMISIDACTSTCKVELEKEREQCNASTPPSPVGLAAGASPSPTSTVSLTTCESDCSEDLDKLRSKLEGSTCVTIWSREGGVERWHEEPALRADDGRHHARSGTHGRRQPRMRRTPWTALAGRGDRWRRGGGSDLGRRCGGVHDAPADRGGAARLRGLHGRC